MNELIAGHTASDNIEGGTALETEHGDVIRVSDTSKCQQ